MNPYLCLVYIPGYFLIAGYVRAVALNRDSRSNVMECDAVAMGLLWPAVVPIVILWHIMLIGSHLHEPERRRQRNLTIAAHENILRILDGKIDEPGEWVE